MTPAPSAFIDRLDQLAVLILNNDVGFIVVSIAQVEKLKTLTAQHRSP
jgi:hypothetical protein